MTTYTQHAPILLVPGHWLGAWAWEDVLDHLARAGFDAQALTLPGLDPTDAQREARTLGDQVTYLEGVVTAAAAPVVIVAHSGAHAPVTLLLDRHPEAVSRVVWVDSGPAADGTVFAPDAQAPGELPPFEVLGAQASLAGLSDADLQRFRARAVPQPAGVLAASVELSNDARFAVATTAVCCSLPSAQILEWAQAGHPVFVDVARLAEVEFVDLPTGHWPMWSRPADLAEVIATSARIR